MGLIVGYEGFAKLQLGYPVNINDTDRKTFTVSSAATDGILPGDLLITTANPKVYTKVTTGSASDYANKIAGIAMATNVKLDTRFPQSDTEVAYMPGEKGNCLVRGEIAVKLHGSAPAEGAAVYFDISNHAFTATEASNIALTNMVFTGKTEGDVTVVNVRY